MKLLETLTSSIWTAGLKTVTCSREGCSRWLTQRHLAERHVGVDFKNQWYCCYRCFAVAAQEQFAQLIASNPASASKHNFRMPIGLTMMSRGLINDSQLRKANEEHKKTGGEVGELALNLGFVDEKQLTSVRAAQWGAPVYALPHHSVPSSIHIPPSLMTTHTMLPLRYSQATNTLMVGFVHAIEYGPLYAIEQITKCKAQPCFLTPTDFWAQMEVQRHGSSQEELTFDNAQSPVSMTRIVCNYGAAMDASEVAMVRCREHIWVRIKGGKKSADLLFQVG